MNADYVCVTTVALLLLACACACSMWLWRRGQRLGAELHEFRASCPIDAETLLRSRTAFNDDLQLEVLRVGRTGRPAALIVLRIDLDAEAGAQPEARHRALARALNSTTRAIDLRYRIGADEFALLLPETRARGGLVVVRRVEKELQAAGVGRITAGVAELGPGIDRQHLFRHAYCALLAAGRDGRSTILAYSLELERSSTIDVELEGVPEIEPA